MSLSLQRADVNRNTRRAATRLRRQLEKRGLTRTDLGIAMELEPVTEVHLTGIETTHDGTLRAYEQIWVPRWLMEACTVWDRDMTAERGNRGRTREEFYALMIRAATDEPFRHYVIALMKAHTHVTMLWEYDGV